MNDYFFGYINSNYYSIRYDVINYFTLCALAKEFTGIFSGTKIQEIFTGEDNYCLVTIPPGVWNGFKGIGVKPAIVANCATVPHDPEEIRRMDPFTKEIPYDWELQHR